MDNTQGYTLIEILAAIAILLVVILSLSITFGDTFSSLFLVGQKVKTIDRAQQRLDELVLIASQSDKPGDSLKKEPGFKGDRQTAMDSTDTDDVSFYFVENEPGVGDTTIQGLTITVIAHYSHGHRYVELTQFVHRTLAL